MPTGLAIRCRWRASCRNTARWLAHGTNCSRSRCKSCKSRNPLPNPCSAYFKDALANQLAAIWLNAALNARLRAFVTRRRILSGDGRGLQNRCAVTIVTAGRVRLPHASAKTFLTALSLSRFHVFIESHRHAGTARLFIVKRAHHTRTRFEYFE